MKISRYTMAARLAKAGPAQHGTLRRFEKGGVVMEPEKAEKIAARHVHPRSNRRVR